MTPRLPETIVAGLIVAALVWPVAFTGGRSTSGRIEPFTVRGQSGWTNVSPSLSPPPMAGATMAYSSREHRFVLFGGWDGVKGLNSTWVYDPVNRTWSALHPAISPLGRG